MGILGVLLAFGAGRGCEAVRGAGTCGGFGLVALIAILGLMVVLGAIMLKAFGLGDPVSTSFLAVGLLAVIAMLFLLRWIDSVWMLLVVPVISLVTYALSWWVTETFIEPAEG